MYKKWCLVRRHSWQISKTCRCTTARLSHYSRNPWLSYESLEQETDLFSFAALTQATRKRPHYCPPSTPPACPQTSAPHTPPKQPRMRYIDREPGFFSKQSSKSHALASASPPLASAGSRPSGLTCSRGIPNRHAKAPRRSSFSASRDTARSSFSSWV